MRITTKLVGTVAAVALVAGAGIAAAPAQAEDVGAVKATGTTLFSFDAKVAALAAAITPVAPAKKVGTNLSFPVASRNVAAGTVTVNANGGITLGAVTVSSPVTVITEKAKTAAISVSFAGNAGVPLFTAAHLKKTTKGKTTTWEGTLNLTTNATVVGILNQAAGGNVFTAGMALGRFRQTVTIK